MNVKGAAKASRRPRRAFDWRSLAEAGVWALTLAGVATMVFVIGGVSDPGLPITIVTMLVGLGLTTRGRRAGPIVLIVASGFLLVFAAFFAAQVLLVPQSTLYFIVNVVFVVAGITTLASAIVLVRGQRRPSNARRFGIVALSLVGVLTVVAIAVRLAYDEPSTGSGNLTISANDDEFIPKKVSVEAGRVTVIVSNEDLSIHTFSIEDFDVGEYLPGGVNSKITFSAAPGTYVYFCDIPGHEDMKGTLRVE